LILHAQNVKHAEEIAAISARMSAQIAALEERVQLASNVARSEESGVVSFREPAAAASIEDAAEPMELSAEPE
jgi:hypothetical protein